MNKEIKVKRIEKVLNFTHSVNIINLPSIVSVYKLNNKMFQYIGIAIIKNEKEQVIADIHIAEQEYIDNYGIMYNVKEKVENKIVSFVLTSIFYE
jgi:hypothetical protein